MLLERDPTTGEWNSHRISAVSECPNRPIVVIDELAQVAHVFEAAPSPPAYDCHSEAARSTRRARRSTRSPSRAASALPQCETTPSADAQRHLDQADGRWIHRSGGAGGGALDELLLALLPLARRRSTAAFSAGTTSGDAPLTVSFADTSSGAPTEWSWNFGDGATSTTQNPTHTYTSPGTYGQPHGHEQRGQHHRTKSGYVTVRSPGDPRSSSSPRWQIFRSARRSPTSTT